MSKARKYLSRSEAAALLDVQPQSISNYAERGLLRTVHSRTNGFIRFLKEDVEALLPHIEEIKGQELAIEEYKEAIEEELRQAEIEEQEAGRLLRASTVRVTYYKQLVEDCYFILKDTQDGMPVNILIRILKGENPYRMAESLGITYYDVRKLCKEALDTLRLLPDYEEMHKQNMRLKALYQDLLREFELLCNEHEVLILRYKEVTGQNDEKQKNPDPGRRMS